MALGSRPRTASIHILDNDSLLHVFHLYRPFLLGEDQVFNAHLYGGNEGWVRGRWWYKLAHVCRRWRIVILESASYLGISLVCTYGTPVADMLAHSPPLPLVIDYYMNRRHITTDDEEGLILAFKQHDRVLRVRLDTFVSLQKFLEAMNEEYPILEHLIIMVPIEDNNTVLKFPESLQAPHLRLLRLQGFALPIGSRLLTTAVGLVTLSLVMTNPSTYFHPNTLLQWISIMPQLETLTVYFKFSTPSRDVVRQLAHTPIIAPITLPNLRHFDFHCVSAYSEALVHRIITPHLKKLKMEFFNQLTYSVPHLLPFIDAAQNLRFDKASFTFTKKRVDTALYPHGEDKAYTLGVVIRCQHLDWQVSSMAQISNSLSQTFSAVEFLTLQHRTQIGTSEEHNEVNRTEWRKLLKPFSNVKTLRTDEELLKYLSRCLQLEDGELPLELLPELEKLEYYGSDDTGDAFSLFIEARRNAGRPVTLVRL